MEQNALVRMPKRINNVRSAQQHHNSAPMREGNANQVQEWSQRMVASSKKLLESQSDTIRFNDTEPRGKRYTLGIQSYQGGDLKHPEDKCNNSDIFEAVSKKALQRSPQAFYIEANV